MAKVQSFQELTVWQRAIDLSVEIYQLTRSFPKEELFGLSSQLRRASVSISSNIAEGQSRITKGEFIQFLSIARGSNAEVLSQLVITRRLGYGDQATIQRCESMSIEIRRMLNALIAALRVAPPRKLS